MEYKIYRLEYKGEIIYIGQTKQELKKRMWGKHPSIPEDIRKECEIFLQENTDDKNREFYWIDYYIEQGCNLYNKRGGKYNKKSEDSMREYRKKYQIETKYYKNYYIINKEKISDWHKEHYEKNKERILEYREKNKDKKREYDRKRREQKNQLLK